MATQFRRPLILVGAATIYSAAVVSTFIYARGHEADTEEIEKQRFSNEGFSPGMNNSSSRSNDCCGSCITSSARVKKFDELAQVYDSRLWMDEMVMGLHVLRWWLVRSAKGDVLEIASGTGRNIWAYPFSKMSSLTVTDSSHEMVMECERKIIKDLSNTDRKKVQAANLDAHAMRQFGNAKFDTIVDTFGLCSFDDPVAVLKECARVVKPGGEILLLEHGRSKTWEGITRLLDSNGMFLSLSVMKMMIMKMMTTSFSLSSLILLYLLFLRLLLPLLTSLSNLYLYLSLFSSLPLILSRETCDYMGMRLES
jgi:ubiquinone/menaquinone biosynthesis C-methylase UbiE